MLGEWSEDAGRGHGNNSPIPWNRFLGSLNVYKFGLCIDVSGCWGRGLAVFTEHAERGRIILGMVRAT